MKVSTSYVFLVRFSCNSLILLSCNVDTAVLWWEMYHLCHLCRIWIWWKELVSRPSFLHNVPFGLDIFNSGIGKRTGQGRKNFLSWEKYWCYPSPVLHPLCFCFSSAQFASCYAQIQKHCFCLIIFMVDNDTFWISIFKWAVGSSQVQWMWTAFTWKLWASCRWTMDNRDFWLCWRYRKL